jgi:GH15 family glucan-1,4-alpha-glucosidase
MPSEIADYALIGDCETAALVGRDGSIDWLCAPRFDSPACFAALLGSPENGRWKLAPTSKARVRRRYRPDTLILETEFRTKDGTVTLIDFMPPRTKNPRIIRMVRGDRGRTRMQMDLVIRFDYGLTVPWVTRGKKRSLIAVSGPDRMVFRTSVPVSGKELHTVSDFVVKAGETVRLELQYGNSIEHIASGVNPKTALKQTEQWWRRWVSRCKYHGPLEDTVRRSLITLKALTYSPTGGIVAAPTTSLPERPGGGRNWDYRYCWLRDATFTLLGFLHAGFRTEARQWKNWLTRSVAGSPSQVQVLYGPAGERLVREWEVAWLPGYRGASPVRIGNAASDQLQLDLYGELADAMYQADSSRKKARAEFDLQFGLLEHLRKIWRQPDHGIWEVRGKQRHFTHSKVMAWVAFDRTIKSAERFGINAPLAKWRAAQRQIHDDVCRSGFNPRIESFVQSYGSRAVDASLLLLPLVGFLPATDPRIVATVRRIEKEVMRGGFVMRFKSDRKNAASRFKEGAFLPCSFWLADYYVLVGRRGEAERLLKRLLRVCNDLGLLSEEYDPAKKRLLGNFPQALSHVALVNTIINLYTERGPARQRSQSKMPG